MYFVLCIYAVSFDVASAIAASRGPYWAGMPPVWVVLTAFPALPYLSDEFFLSRSFFELAWEMSG